MIPTIHKLQKKFSVRFESTVLLCMLLVLGLTVIGPWIASDAIPQTLNLSFEDKEVDEEDREIENPLNYLTTADGMYIELDQRTEHVSALPRVVSFAIDMRSHPQRGPPSMMRV